MKVRMRASAKGRPVMMYPEARACAVRVRISPWIRMRSRMVKAIVSRISARLPPTTRWICTAVTIRSKSSLSIRLTMWASESSTETPRFISRTARLNSSAIGRGQLLRQPRGTPALVTRQALVESLQEAFEDTALLGGRAGGRVVAVHVQVDLGRRVPVGHERHHHDQRPDGGHRREDQLDRHLLASFSGRIRHRREQFLGHALARRLQMVEILGHDAGGREVALHLTVFADAGLLEHENVLHLYLVAVQTEHLADGDDP